MEAWSVPLDATVPGRSAVINQFVTFTSGGAFYGVEIMSVREIRSWQPTTPLPQRAVSARGVLDIRGSIVEVFDLGVVLGGPPLQATSGSVVLVLALENATVGLLVESVSDIIQVQDEDRMSVPDESAGGQRWGGEVECMVNHEGRLIGILDLYAIFPNGNNSLPRA